MGKGINSIKVWKEITDRGLDPKVEVIIRGRSMAILPGIWAYEFLTFDLWEQLAIGEASVMGSREFYNVTPEELEKAASLSPAEIREEIRSAYLEAGGEEADILWLD